MKQMQFPQEVPLKGRVKVCLDLLLSLKIKGKIIVDIGSSFGWLEKEAIKYYPKQIIGIEPNSEAVTFATKNVPKAKFYLGKANNLPVKSNYADIVTLFDVIEHIPKNTEELVLKEAGRVLKQGGKLLLSTPNAHIVAKILDLAWYFGHRHYSSKTLTLMLKRSGYKVEKINARGSFWSSFYLFWFYIMKKITGKNQPRNKLIEKLDDAGYDNGAVTDIFLVAKKI